MMHQHMGVRHNQLCRIRSRVEPIDLLGYFHGIKHAERFYPGSGLPEDKSLTPYFLYCISPHLSDLHQARGRSKYPPPSLSLGGEEEGKGKEKKSPPRYAEGLLLYSIGSGVVFNARVLLRHQN